MKVAALVLLAVRHTVVLATPPSLTTTTALPQTSTVERDHPLITATGRFCKKMDKKPGLGLPHPKHKAHNTNTHIVHIPILPNIVFLQHYYNYLLDSLRDKFIIFFCYLECVFCMCTWLRIRNTIHHAAHFCSVVFNFHSPLITKHFPYI